MFFRFIHWFYIENKLYNLYIYLFFCKSQHIFNIQKNISKKENKFLKEISQNYIQYINEINIKRKSASKNFYIIIYYVNDLKQQYIGTEEIIKNDLKEKYFKIKECLSRCGNYVEEINDELEIQKLFLSFFYPIKNNKNNSMELNKYIY